jgi:O-antigen/teichoic acid export membrane protein
MIKFRHFFSNNKLTAKLIGFISKSPIYSGALVIGGGAVVAQLIGMVTLPLITRIYNPTEMGMLAVYSSILSIAVIAATFRYEFAYTLPKKEETAAHLFVLCITILFLTSIAFSIVVIFAGDALVNLLGLNSLGQYYWLLIPGFIGAGLYQILNYWSIRQRDYKRITYTKINQSVSGAASKIVLGLLSVGPMGLIIGQIISQVAGVGTLGKAMWKAEKKNLKNISFSGIKSVAKEYWTFPMFNLPASIVNTLSLQLPSLFLAAFYGSHTVGLYFLAHSLLVLPASLVSSSIGQAFLGEISKMVREESSGLRQLYLKTVKHLSLIAIPTIGVLALAAPFLIALVFGDEWTDAGLLCIPLALMVIPQFVVSPTDRLTIYGYNHWTLIWDITRVAGVIVSFYISYHFGFPVLIALTSYATIMLIMYIINILLNLKAISKFTSKN